MAYNFLYDIMAYNKSYSHIEDIMKICSYCTKEFIETTNIQKYCDVKCKIMGGIKKIDEGCWLFRKSSSGQYGKIRWNKKWYPAHRLSYITFKGEIPEGKWVCHTCDIPLCINPDHLFIGSASDNARDAFSKKRRPIGEDVHFAKFTDKQVKQMRLLKQEGFTYKRLSEIFNCSFPYLYKIFKNKLRIGI